MFVPFSFLAGISDMAMDKWFSGGGGILPTSVQLILQILISFIDGSSPNDGDGISSGRSFGITTQKSKLHDAPVHRSPLSIISNFADVRDQL